VRQRLAEQGGEQERREVVDLEGQLVPVAGDGACSGGDQPGVVDQDVDPRVPGCQLPGELANLIEMREVGDVPTRAQSAGDCAGFRGRSPATAAPRSLSDRAAAAPMPSLAPVTTIVQSRMAGVPAEQAPRDEQDPDGRAARTPKSATTLPAPDAALSNPSATAQSWVTGAALGRWCGVPGLGGSGHTRALAARVSRLKFST
jgi:hypothetical protein